MLGLSAHVEPRLVQLSFVKRVPIHQRILENMRPYGNCLFAELKLIGFLDVVCHEVAVDVTVDVLGQKLK